MKRLLFAVLLLTSTPALADVIEIPQTFKLAGVVYHDPVDTRWNVKGLPYGPGTPVTGTFNYIIGGFTSPAVIDFTIGEDHFTIDAIASTVNHGPDGNGVMIKGLMPNMDAEVAIMYMGDLCGMCNIRQLLPDPRTIWYYGLELQIRNRGAFFWTGIFSNNEQRTIFLNAPIKVTTPEPGTLALLAMGIVGVWAVRRSSK